ncbi:hypothetical protein F2Q69_00038454 [Brassica cretica]|uniref:Uncharacterized protein n=1 Tax=Brassica cretica TaxID=69181 RepID=A0A8S9SR03_BRACR|nr:hypothetical protein F2Q69_00038454 [Brassica cretica]
MKKKKPKVSPAKSSPKSFPPAKSLTPKSDDKDLLHSSPVFVSDAQTGLVANEVTQQAGGSADLVPGAVLTFSDKTEIIDASTDPFSVLDEVLPLMPESSSMVPPSSSSASDPTEEIGSVKAATSAALLIATADANNVRLSSQLADEITVTKVSGPVELEGVQAHCPQKKRQEAPVKRTRRGRSKDTQKWMVVDATADTATQSQLQVQAGAFHQVQSEPPKSPLAASHSSRSKMELFAKSKLGTEKDKAVGESSGTTSYLQPMLTRSRSGSGISRSSHSEDQPDSSDIESSNPELEKGEFNTQPLGMLLTTYITSVRNQESGLSLRLAFKNYASTTSPNF